MLQSLIAEGSSPVLLPMDFLAGLNPPQREAVQHVEGPLLILAGAGSGKTRVITHRISHLISTHGVFGPSILAVTFTNKAAGEMRERVLKLLGGRLTDSRPTVSTFHSFCVRLLRRDGASLHQLRPGFTTSFQIYDADDQLALVKSIYKKLGLDEKFMQYRAALSRISHAKNHQQSPEDLYKAAADPKLARLAKVFDDYENGLKSANALDFDDLLLWAVRLLRHDGEALEAWNHRLEFLMIDEYQDTNRSQYELMRLLSAARQNVAVVGDEDQSIYGWRGADINNILDFEKDFPNARVIRLEQNYRSTRTIIEAAGAVVANNKARKGKWLHTENEEGSPVCYYEAADGEQEAMFIASTIGKIRRSEPDTRFAVLYRTNFQSRQIEEALRRYNIGYLVVGGFSFYQRAEVKDALAYVKLLLNPNDSVSLMRVLNVPARGIGKTTVEQLESLAARNGISIWQAIGAACDQHLLGARAEASLGVFRRLIGELRETIEGCGPQQVLLDILERTGYRKMLEAGGTPEDESRMGNLEELVSAAADAHERGESLIEFLDQTALVADADQLDESAQVSLLTMHNAKGLEFPVVFIAGMEDGLFPHSRSRESEAQLEEERRLCYVAMTRAERRLYLSSARMRRRYGGSPPEPCFPSRFLREIPASMVENLHETSRPGDVDLYAERSAAREVARRNTYTGATYNSIGHIKEFFANRAADATPVARPAAMGATRPAAPAPAPELKPAAAKPTAKQAPQRRSGLSPGATVYHSKYGRGTILRKEGDGDDAKLVISFHGFGLKKLIAKFAQLKTQS
jgi:DNA helicase II / ATP-dependent DNA helicase PcrA